jgi:plastocyanin
MKAKLVIPVALAIVLILTACGTQSTPIAVGVTEASTSAPTLAPTDVPPTATMGMPTVAATSAPVASNVVEGKAVNVDIANFAFAPQQLTIHAGTTVTWINNDSAAHTVTADDGSFDSGRLATGAKFAFTFNQTGTFTYKCNFHSSMTATITVVQ